VELLPLRDVKRKSTGVLWSDEKPSHGGEDIPQLVRQTSGALGSIAGRIEGDPEVVKTLRTMPSDARPVAFWRLAQDLPQGCDASAGVILRGIGSIAHHVETETDKRPQCPGFGAILAQVEFPESRVDRLLAASGETLRGLAYEAIRFALSCGVTRADWRSLAGLLIADELGDDEAWAWCRRRLASEYVRVVPTSASASAS
jgi:hypothetical protein